MLPPHQRVNRASETASNLALALGTVPRSARRVLPAFTAAFEGTDVSTLEPRTRALLPLRVSAVDHAPNWRERFEEARVGGIEEDEVGLIGSDEWESAPAYTDRERAAILWGDRVVRASFDEREVVELTLAACLFNFLNASTTRPGSSSTTGRLWVHSS